MDILNNRMSLFHDNPVVNWHEHVWDTVAWGSGTPGIMNVPACHKLVAAARATGTDTLLCSCPVVNDRFCTPEHQRVANDVIVEAMKMYPDIIRGMCYVNPGLGDASVDEIDRCVNEHGMVGIKMYHQYFINDPVQFKIIEKCIDLDIPILVHAGKLCYDPLSQPHVSNGVHFAEIAKRYPEAHIIMAHITGGGDWQWSLKAIENSPNVVTDLSGSVCDSNVVEETVRYLGADRVLWGTDGSIYAGVGKMLAANISDADKKKILSGGSYNRFLERGRK
ncbi:MAG: amidohydrolase family protein [Clostridia bacterium]